MGVMAAAGAAAMLSCTDTWNDHYDAGADVSYSGTTMQALEEKAPDFAAVIKAVGYNRELASENVYTIWAPASFNKDSVLTLAAKDSAAVVNQFVKNHIARYAISQNGTDQTVKLMSAKNTQMTAAGMFGSAKITQPNLSCANGVLHIIDANIGYHFNVFEKIKNVYDTNPQDVSLYSFLQRWDADSLDEARSVSRGVDENGDKIWVDSVTIRNNTVLKNVNALLYREDSSYIAIIPTAAAYQERYNIAKSLLNFNESQASRDSLQDYHANMFAMTDLYYNKNINQEALADDGVTYDSLRSTNYRAMNWPNNLYYTKAPRTGLHPDKQLNDILSKSGTPVDCSNGTAYVVDTYPMDVTEQFFKKIQVFASNNSVDNSSDLYTKNISSSRMSMGTFPIYEVTPVVDDETGEVIRLDSTKIGDRSYRYSDIVPSSNNDFSISYKIPSTLSGKYELYIVTCPIWAKDGYEKKVTEIVTDPETGEEKEVIRNVGPEDDPRNYHFEVKLWQRRSDGTYPNEGTTLTPPAGTTPAPDGNYFVTDYTNPIDTLYVGDITLTNAYYGLDTEGVMIQVHGYKMNSQRNYSLEMLLSSFILKPKFEDSAVATDAKRK